MMLPLEPGPAKAAFHYRRAGAYLQLAQAMMAQPSTYASAQMAVDKTPFRALYNLDADIRLASAGALLYEAAKQSVNAVANLNGRDPQANHEKMAALRTVANAHPTYRYLARDARSALDLHIHADQAHLSPDELVSAMERTRRFIADLQSIYRAIAPTP